MFSKIARIVSQQSNGVRTWRDHVNKVFAEFHGNELGARKGDAFAAKLLNLKNANTLFALESQGKDAYEAAVAILEALCTRPTDNNFGDGYYDFFQPLMVVSWNPEWGEPVGQEPVLLGVFTTIYCDDETRRLEFRQSLKVSLPTGFPGGADYHDAYFSDTQLFATGQAEPLRVGGLTENGAKALRESEDPIIEERLAHFERLRANGQMLNYGVHIDLLRCCQTLEMDRIVSALGQHPKMDFTHAGSANSLYEGVIGY